MLVSKCPNRIRVIVQIETRASYDSIDEICAVDGVEAIFIGPHDLAASIGHLVDTQHENVQALIREVPKKCALLGKTAGILASSVEEAKRYADLGYTFVGVGSDLGLLKAAALQAARAMSIGTS